MIMKKDRHSGFFSGLYQRNETFLAISAGIFFGAAIVGYLFAGFLDPLLAPQLQNLQRQASEGIVRLETFSLFKNNVTIAFFIYAGGILLGTVSAFLLVSNGAFIGYVASKTSISTFLIFTIPHGIFEVTGIIIAGAAGFRLGSGVFNYLNGVTKLKRNISIKNQLAYLLEANMDEFKDSLSLFAIAVVLLIIAAFIEANFTVVWGQYIQSLL
jgi:stage II sporulation protein M